MIIKMLIGSDINKPHKTKSQKSDKHTLQAPKDARENAQNDISHPERKK